MSYNGGVSMHKRPLDNPPYQGPGAYQGGSADIKRSRPEMGAGGGSGGGGNNLSIYGPPGDNGGSSPGTHPRRPGLEACMHFRRTGNCKFGSSCRYGHSVNDPPPSNPEGDLRNGHSEGRGVVPRTPCPDGPSYPTQQSRQSGGQQQQQASNVVQTKEHEHSPRSSSQHHHPSTSPFQPYSQQPPKDQPQQLPQQGGTGHYAQGQGLNSSGVGGTPGAAFHGNTYGVYSSSTSNMSSPTPSTAGAQTPVSFTARPSNQRYATSGSSRHVSTSHRAVDAVADGHGDPLDAAGALSSGKSSAYGNPPHTQHSSVGSAATQQSGGAPGSSSGMSGAISSASIPHGWVYDPNTGGYRMPPAPASATSTSRGTGPPTAATGTAGPVQSDTGSKGVYGARSHNPFESSAQKAITEGYGVSGNPEMGIRPDASSPTAQGAVYGQDETAGSSASSVYDDSGRNTSGISRRVRDPVRTSRNGTAAASSVDGGFAAPTATLRSYGASASSFCTSADGVAQPNDEVTSKSTSRYAQAPDPGASSANSGSAQSTVQSVSAISGYGDVSGRGYSGSSFSTFGQQSQGSLSSQRPEQPVAVYSGVESSTGSTVPNGGNSSATSPPSRFKDSSSSNAGSNSSSGVASSNGSGGDSGTGRGAHRSIAGSPGSGGSETTGGSMGATPGGPSASPPTASGGKEAVGSSSLTYATQVSPHSISAGGKDAPQSVAGATLPSVALSPQPLHPQQATVTVLTGAAATLNQDMVGYGLVRTNAPYAVPSAVQGAQGSQRAQYMQHQPQQLPPQQSAAQQQQPLGAAGQFIMAPQGQGHPHLQQLPQGQQPQQQTWQQQGIQQFQQQPLQQQPPMQGQATVGQPPNQGSYAGSTASVPAPGMPVPAPQQHPGYGSSALSPFGQVIQQQPSQQQQHQQQLPQQGSGVAFSRSPGLGGIFQPGGQGDQLHGIPDGAPIFNHPVTGSGAMPQIIENPCPSHLPQQPMMPLPVERGGAREGRRHDGREGTKYDPLNPAPNMPQRSSQPECNHFVKTGFCRFGTTCRYHHPYHRVGQQPVSEANVSSRNSNVVQQQDRAPCDVYLNKGLCTFGEKCRFRHVTRGQLAMESARGVTHPDPNHLPHRAGLPTCGFYTRTGKCAFGMKCKFDHPRHRNPSNKTPGSGPSCSTPEGVRTVSTTQATESGAHAQQLNSSSGHTARVDLPNSSPMKSELKGRPAEVTARHILIKHKGSRRPASWQDPSGVAIKQRTQAEASTILQNLRAGIKTEEDFSKVAMAKSDCSSAKRGGDLSSFGRGKMQRAFEDAAFGLEIGGVSEVVATDSGVHLIMRTA